MAMAPVYVNVLVRQEWTGRALMDFKYSDEAEAFRREFRAWLEANIPHNNDSDKRPDTGGEFLRSDEGDWNLALQWHRKMNAGGWVGVSWPKAYGGRGATLEQMVVYNEEMVRARAPGIVNGLGIMLVGPTLIHWGTEEQKQRYVPKILSAEEIWCQGYSEPGAGSDVASLEYARGRGRRLFYRQWPESLDLGRGARRLVHPARPHRPRGAQAQGHQLSAGRSAQSRRHGASTGADDRIEGLQRGILRGRQGT
jgi:hypothetical protein